MNNRMIKSIGLAALFGAVAITSHADVTLFQDNFEGTNLVKWIGKSGAPINGQIVADPLNPANHVLTFTAVNFSGDMFTATPLDVSRPRHYVLSFDFLGAPSAVENGGFIGISQTPTGDDSQQVWIGGTAPGAITAPPGVGTVLIVDAHWHHYDIDITPVIDAKDLLQTLLMLEDWYAFGTGLPGDAYFDNIKLVGVFDVNTVVAQVPCSGPTPTTKWKNHGAYVSTVSAVAQAYLAANIITPEEVRQITDIAGKSDCGNKK